MRLTSANDDVRVSAKTSGSVPSGWPSFVLAPAEEAPEVSLHQIEGLSGTRPLAASPAARPTVGTQAPRARAGTSA